VAASPAGSRSRARSISLLAGIGAVGSLAVVAVPVLQGVVVWRTARPPVPGPHVLDGLIGMRRAGPDVAGPVQTAAGEPLTLVWLGDSLACGVGAATPEAAFPHKTATLWSEADGRPVRLTCLARPGACTADVLADQVPVALDLLGPGCAAVVTVGSNDVGSLNHPGRYRRAYATVLDALAGTGATVIAVGLPDMGSAVVMRRPLRTLARWVGANADRHVRRMAEAHGAHYVHIALRAPRGTPFHEYLAADRWHPNDETYHRWAQGVAETLGPVLALPVLPAG
jgi:lysophospholipase L1-like esterase